MVAGGDAGGGKGWVARNFSFFFLSLEGGWIYTHLAGGRRSVHCFRYRPFHSAPNTRPLVLSCCRIFTRCTRTHESIIPFTLFHLCTIVSFSVRFHVSTRLFRYFFSSFFFSLLAIYTRAHSRLSFSYSATFKYRIFRNN